MSSLCHMFQITVNALIKRASLFLQSEQKDKCFKDFETAIALDPDNPDIYLHRGQVCFPLLNFTVEPLITGFRFSDACFIWSPLEHQKQLVSHSFQMLSTNRRRKDTTRRLQITICSPLPLPDCY